MKRFLYAFIFVFGTVCTSNAQIDPLFFQQTHLRGLINPSATGKGGNVGASMSLRQQWTGFPAPSFQAILAHGFSGNLRSGIGLSGVMLDDGPLQTKNIKLNYAYFVPFEEFAFFSLGMGAGIMSSVYRDGSRDFIVRDEDDPVLTGLEPQSKLLPDFDFGFEFNTRHFEMGASSTHVTYGWYDNNVLRPQRNFYVYSRVKQPLNNNWDLIYGVTWHNNRRVNTYEAIASVRYNNNVCVDFAYRNPMSLGVAAGVTLYEGFRVVYSYDYGFDFLKNNNKGSHEVTLSYTVDLNNTYVKNKLRFFKWKIF